MSTRSHRTDKAPAHLERVALALFLLLGSARASAQEDLSAIWNDPLFMKQFVAGYGVNAEVEPRLSVDDVKFLEKIRPLMADNLPRAEEAIRKHMKESESAQFDFMLGGIQFQQDKSLFHFLIEVGVPLGDRAADLRADEHFQDRLKIAGGRDRRDEGGAGRRCGLISDGGLARGPCLKPQVAPAGNQQGNNNEYQRLHHNSIQRHRLRSCVSGQCVAPPEPPMRNRKGRIPADTPHSSVTSRENE